MKKTLILISSLFIFISNIQSRTLVYHDWYLEENMTTNEELVFIGDCYIDGGSRVNGLRRTLKVNNLVLLGERTILKLEDVILDCSDGEIEVEAEGRIILIGNNAKIIFPQKR